MLTVPTHWIRSGAARIGLGWLGLLLLAGCQMTAPIHVWKQPSVTQGGSVRVAVTPIGGDPEVAERLQASLVNSQPQTMPQLAVVYPGELERVGGIQLVSYDGEPSDMAALGAARRAGVQYVLSGHVVSHQFREDEAPIPSQSWWRRKRDTGPKSSLTVRWIIYEVASGKRVGDSTVTMDRSEAEEQYPDLAFQAEEAAKIYAASARRSWEFVIPTTHPTEARLDLPWLSWGSAKVRQGNALARLGRWEEAERAWQDAVDQNPKNIAAWNNLSIAAVAHEDFPLAHDRLKHADSKWWPGHEREKTLRWIEQRQREYHAAFQLPPPPQGWQFSESDRSAPPFPPVAPPIPTVEIASRPKSLDEQPWYTTIPFIPPPGWTWTQWWSQPWF